MSVCVLVKVGEGLVLASDSATTVSGAAITPGGQQGPQGVVKIFNNATKIFQIRDLPIGVLTWGAGSFKARTIASLVEEFENQSEIQHITKDELNVNDMATRLWNFMLEKSNEFFHEIPQEGRPRTGLILCGYSNDDFFPEEYSMVTPNERPSRIRPPIDSQPDFGANWYGQTDAIIRFHFGRDDRVFDLLERGGIDPTRINSIKDSINSEIQYPVLFQVMPLADAIDYAEFLVNLMIGRFRFAAGAEVCGGPVDVAVITRKEGFCWITNKRAFLNK